MKRGLSRTTLRHLAPGQRAYEGGVCFERLPRGDGRWSVDVMVARVRHRFVVGLESEGFTLTQARDAIATLRAKKRERQHGISSSKAKAVTFGTAADLYLQHLERTGGKDVAKKRQRIDLHLRPELGPVKLEALDARRLREYRQARLAKGAKPATVNRELAVVSHLFTLATDRDALGLVTAPPCRVPRLKEAELPPQHLTPTQAQKLIEAASADPNPHVACFVMVGLHTGMRLSAVLRIRVADLDLQRRVIWVVRDKAGERQQPMTSELAEYLAAYQCAHLVDGAVWLFPSAKSKTGHAVNLYKPFVRCLKAAGLPHAVSEETGRRQFVIHSLRHTMATQAADAGVSPATLQELGGWKSRRMVERYTHATSLRDAMAKLEAALRPPPAPEPAPIAAAQNSRKTPTRKRKAAARSVA